VTAALSLKYFGVDAFCEGCKVVDYSLNFFHHIYQRNYSASLHATSWSSSSLNDKQKHKTKNARQASHFLYWLR
jgi:hypothetical protein